MDLFLTHKRRPSEGIFIEEEVTGPTELKFNIEHVRFDAETEENIPVKTETIQASEFTGWWLVKLAEGWRIKT